MSVFSRFRRHHGDDLIPPMRLGEFAALGSEPEPAWRGGQIDLATGRVARPPDAPLAVPPGQCCRRVGPGGTLHWYRCPVGLAEEQAVEWFPLTAAPGRPADREAVCDAR